MKADLHIHSCFSNDGDRSVADILETCKSSGLGLFSITDHNGIQGSREAAGLCSRTENISFIPGIEIDCHFRGTDLHLLGYGVDLHSRDFGELEKRVERMYLDSTPHILRKLKALGLEMDEQALMDKAAGKAPTGEQMAEVLLENPAHRSHPLLRAYLPGGSRSDMPLINFYLDFMAQGKPAHVKIQHMDFSEAVALVRHNGGWPVVAHPGLNFKGRENQVSKLLDQGAQGLEVFNNYHSTEQAAYFADLSQKKGTWMTCGSDFHGKTKPLISIGQFRMLKAYKDSLDRSLETIRMAMA
jgi:predicted metal-dependent phosphoesterase TrpH